jgi:hypothetical protein
MTVPMESNLIPLPLCKTFLPKNQNIHLIHLIHILATSRPVLQVGRAVRGLVKDGPLNALVTRMCEVRASARRAIGGREGHTSIPPPRQSFGKVFWQKVFFAKSTGRKESPLPSPYHKCLPPPHHPRTTHPPHSQIISTRSGDALTVVGGVYGVKCVCVYVWR